MIRRRPLLAALATTLVLALTGAPAAFAEGPWWHLSSEVVPSYLPPGGEGQIILDVSNLGDAPINGENGHPATLTIRLPGGVTAMSAGGGMRCTLTTLICTYSGVLYPYEQLTVPLKVQIAESLEPTTSVQLQASLEGGGAPSMATSQRLTISPESTPYGVQNYELSPENAHGGPAIEAGSHPFQLTSTLALNQTLQPGGRQPVALPKDLRFNLPPGLLGNPSAVAQCSMTDFSSLVLVTNLCPPNTVVGVATVTVFEPLVHVITLTVPVFNLTPSQGEPARLGFEVLGKIPVVIDTAVAAGGDYHVVASVQNASEAGALLSSQVTLWGVPGDHRHDQERGWECVSNGFYQKDIGNKPCPASTDLPPNPFLTMPGSCAESPDAEPLLSSVETDAWTNPGAFISPPPSVWSGPGGEPLGLEDCSNLGFAPALEVTPEHDAGSTPSGVDVSVRIPPGGLLEAEGSAEADVRDTTVALPNGVQVNPSAANGLQACPEADVGFTGFQDFQPGSPTATFTQGFEFTPPEEPKPGESFCPQASKLGTVLIKTLLLPQQLEGAVYLAEPAPNGEDGKNPFNSLIALYIVAEDKQAGVLVKLAGGGKLDPVTGQITTSFNNTPQLPFEELKLKLFGGERASLSTPAHCGGYEASSVFDAWSGAVAEPASEPFEVTSGIGGGPCASGALGFSPGFLAQSVDTQAGAFTPFEVEIARPDGDEALSGVSVSLPAGIAALLSSVTPCQEPASGAEWDCGPGSLIGHSTAQSGLGSEPVVLGGDVYLTSGYDGAPFGLLVRTHAAAGPFDLGYVNVRSRINVNPETAAVTITTDSGPHGDALITMLKGIPVQLKRLLVTVDRPGFEFNPTSCEPMSIQGSLLGSEGATAAVSSRFQVGGCESLPFHPNLTATVGGHANKADGTRFDVKVTSQGLGVANIKKVDLQIPAQLPSRQSTLNLACLAATFQANPASCPEGSVIGSATVHTPVLKSPLSGPAYLVSYGNAKFPDVEFVLQGEGITLVLDGHTDIKNGITYSRFETAPDAPFTSFETSLPAGPHGILTAYASEKEPYELCDTKLTMPTTITAQDGAVIQQNTPVTPTGCSGVLAKKTTKPTRAQQLAKGLAACRHKYHTRKTRAKRAACEKQARKHYAPPTKKKIARKARRAIARAAGYSAA